MQTEKDQHDVKALAWNKSGRGRGREVLGVNLSQV